MWAAVAVLVGRSVAVMSTWCHRPLENAESRTPQRRGPAVGDCGSSVSVELRGLEPLTLCMPCRCATSCATAPTAENISRRTSRGEIGVRAHVSQRTRSQIPSTATVTPASSGTDHQGHRTGDVAGRGRLAHRLLLDLTEHQVQVLAVGPVGDVEQVAEARHQAEQRVDDEVEPHAREDDHGHAGAHGVADDHARQGAADGVPDARERDRSPRPGRRRCGCRARSPRRPSRGPADGSG